jgi:hypothetical protein
MAFSGGALAKEQVGTSNAPSRRTARYLLLVRTRRFIGEEQLIIPYAKQLDGEEVVKQDLHHLFTRCNRGAKSMGSISGSRQ